MGELPTRVEQDAGHGTVTLEDRRALQADLVVAADGVHSAAVAHVLGDTEIGARDTGWATLRWLVPTEELVAVRRPASWLGRGFRGISLRRKGMVGWFGILVESELLCCCLLSAWLLTDRRVTVMRCRISCICLRLSIALMLLKVRCRRLSSCTPDRHVHTYCSGSRLPRYRRTKRPIKVRNERLRTRIASRRQVSLSTANAFEPQSHTCPRKAQDVKYWKLVARDPLHTWHNDRLVLIGDAAHPTLPCEPLPTSPHHRYF